MFSKNYFIYFGEHEANDRGEHWSINAPQDEKIDGVVLLFFEQGESCQTDHHQRIRLFNKNNLGTISMNTFEEIIKTLTNHLYI